MFHPILYHILHTLLELLVLRQNTECLSCRPMRLSGNALKGCPTLSSSLTAPTPLVACNWNTNNFSGSLFLHLGSGGYFPWINTWIRTSQLKVISVVTILLVHSFRHTGWKAVTGYQIAQFLVKCINMPLRECTKTLWRGDLRTVHKVLFSVGSWTERRIKH